MSSHDNTVVHTQDAAGAGLGSQLRLTLGGVLPGDNKLNEKGVGHLNTFQRLGIAGELELLGVRLVLVGEVVEFHLNLAISAGKVRLPAIVEVLLAKNADLLAGEGVGLELIRDGDHGSVHGSGKVAIEKDGEGECVTTFSESICAVALVGSLLEDVKLEGSSKASNLDNLVLDIQKHLPSDERTSALLGVAVEDYWRALDAPVDGNI
ncbi:hypothetical protein HG531_007311 [Fusarium graminearum]|nr:hypothetical protein HG531_007311 [Fusarium graminearum]